MPDENPNKIDNIIAKYEQTDDFESRYANNVFFSTSIFDVKMVFGDILQFPNAQPFVAQHTGITLSWREAKIAALFLVMNVAMHENQFGTLDIPSGILPPHFQRTAEEGKLPLLKLMEFVGERPPVKPDVPSPEGKTQ